MLKVCMRQFHIYIFVVIFSVLSIFSVNAWASELQQNTNNPFSGNIYEEGNDLSFLGQFPIAPWQYQQMLGKGIDVDWSKTKQGRESYHSQVVKDFREKGVSHVRIRIKDEPTEELLKGLDVQIADCLESGILPIIAYQGEGFKKKPNDKTIQDMVTWWATIAKRYQNTSYLLSFDLLIESSDAVNQKPEISNQLYENVVEKLEKQTLKEFL